MQAVEHSPEFARKVGIPQSVGRKFAEHKAKGGLAHLDVKQDKTLVREAVHKHERHMHKGEPLTKLARGGLAHLAEGGLPMAAMPTLAAGVPGKGALNLFSNLMEYVRNLNLGKALPAEGWEQMLKAPEYRLEGVKFPIPPEEHQFFNTQDILSKIRQEGKPVDKAGMLERLAANEPKLSTSRLPTHDEAGVVDRAAYDSEAYRLPGLGPTTFENYKNYSEDLTHYQPRLQDVDPLADPDLPYAQLEDFIEQDSFLHGVRDSIRLYVTGDGPMPDLGYYQSGLVENQRRMFKDAVNPTFRPAAGHFGSNNENLLSHSRATQRQTVDGAPVRLVEEIQSDWHQQARDKGGYRTSLDKAEDKHVPSPEGDEIRSRIDELEAADELDDDELRELDSLYEELIPVERAEVDESKPPIAPFRKNYGTVELKKQLADAIENGDHYLAWTTGEQQRDRYASALKKQVDKIRWGKNPDGTYWVTPLKNSKVLKDAAQDKVKASDLDTLLGKEMAEKIRMGGDRGALEGPNLTVGGQGMRQFYDKDLRTAAEKLVRQYGGDPATDIQMVKVPGGSQIPQEFAYKLDDFSTQLNQSPGRHWSGMAERIMDDAMDRFDLEAQNALEGPIVDAITFMGDADEAGDFAAFKAAFNEYKNLVHKFYRENGSPSEVPAIRITDKMRETYNRLKAKTGSGFSRYAAPPLVLGPIANHALTSDDSQWQ